MDLHIFQGGVLFLYFLFLGLCFLGFMEFKGGGSCITFSMRGITQNEFREGGSFLIPLLSFYPPPPLRERIRSSDVLGKGFLKKTIKKSPFDNHFL
jgi:hypothetical protein